LDSKPVVKPAMGVQPSVGAAAVSAVAGDCELLGFAAERKCEQ
jgi:hypothetical protein